MTLKEADDLVDRLIEAVKDRDYLLNVRSATPNWIKRA